MNFSSTAVNADTFVVKITTARATVEIAEDFKEELLRHIENGHPRGVVDFSSTEFIDSAFLGALVTGLKRATLKKGDLRIVSLQEPVKAMFEITRLNRIFNIHDSVEEALTGLR